MTTPLSTMPHVAAYSQQIQEFTQQVDALKKKSFALSMLRVLLFSLMPLGIYQYYHHPEQTYWLFVASIALIAFLALIRFHQELSRQLTLAETLLNSIKMNASMPLTTPHPNSRVLN
ncbi:MAG TPA: hypothetical protein PLU10_06070 [Chitinophagaceae bacterium]|nr:hypothetical protein [Chitinophagaceae bacterium]